MKEEEWRDIAGYEGKYQVSNLGHVKSLNYGRTGKERILSLRTCKGGYLLVNLCKNGIVKCYSVHRLVARAFIENPDNLPQVNHKNQVKTDNTVQNLEWCTAEYNIRYSDICGKGRKSVGCYKNGELIKVYPSLNSVKKDGFNDGNVYSVLKGNRKFHGGYQWKYIE